MGFERRVPGATGPGGAVAHFALTALAALAATTVAGCGAGPAGRPGGAPMPHGEIVVFAAASLAGALPELGERFERERGWRVAFHFGSSGALARQIESGAPADVFFSADARRMDRLIEAGLVDATEAVRVLSNELVVVVPRGRPAGADSGGVEALTAAGRVVMGDPATVPAGTYARAWLEGAGLWAQVRDRVVPVLDVRAVLAAVEAGHADAGIVYRTDASRSNAVRVAHAASGPSVPDVAYVLAPVGPPVSDTTPAMRMDPARDLVAFLAAPGSAADYERHGFRFVAPGEVVQSR